MVLGAIGGERMEVNEVSSGRIKLKCNVELRGDGSRARMAQSIVDPRQEPPE